MKFKFNKRYFRIGITAFAVIAASICFYFLIFHGDRFSAQLDALIRVVSPVMYGIIFAYLMTPMVNGIENRFILPLLSNYIVYCGLSDLWVLFYIDSQYCKQYQEHFTSVSKLYTESDRLVSEVSGG